MMDLNSEQLLAAEHIEGPMLVLAGAGSGKTRVVTCRIAHLLNLGVPSSEILALTFTNKAAQEMRQRIQTLSKQFVLTCTFHSLGARILRESIHALGYSNDFTIYDEKDSMELLKSCLTSFGIKNEKGLLKSLRIGISNAKNALLSKEDLKSDFQSREEQLLGEIFTIYQGKLKEYNALDFDDLLYLPVKLFKAHPDILLNYQKSWNFILIDEYQDTNAAQYFITKLLSATHRNLFAVGDPDQSIYSWRGANISNILDFEKDYEGAKTISLEQNYRSTSIILEGANNLIACNESRYEKKLWSSLGPGEKIALFRANNEKEEAQFVAEEILRLKKEHKLPLKECVVFYRTNAQSRNFEDAFLKLNIPYAIIGGISFYQRREIKDILAFLRMVVSEADFLSFARTINLPKRGIGPTTLKKLQDLAEEMQLPILSLCEKIVSKEFSLLKLSAKQEKGLASYLQVLTAIKNLVKAGTSLEEIVFETIDKTDYLNILKTDPQTYEDRSENLDALINKAAEWGAEKETQSLINFLEELSLKSSLDDTSFEDTVCLMTIHNGKGLEFEAAFIVGLEEDLFPHINSKDSPDALEEERRLCYVGMTRAKKHLYLTTSTYRFIWGTPKVMRPSRFLKEIPVECTTTLSQEKDVLEQVWEEEEGFEVGTAVFHKDFGKGVVKKSYQTSLGLTYDVYFLESHSTRTLVAKYAKFTTCS